MVDGDGHAPWLLVDFYLQHYRADTRGGSEDIGEESDSESNSESSLSLATEHDITSN